MVGKDGAQNSKLSFRKHSQRQSDNKKFKFKSPKQMNIIYREIRSQNIVHFFQQTHFGIQVEKKLKTSLAIPYARDLESFQIQDSCSPFNRRVTCIRWHPNFHSSLAASSHGGDLILWDYQSKNMEFLEGIGAGGSITEMKFNVHNDHQMYTTSVCGELALQDFQRKTRKPYLETMDWEKWYCTVDVSPCSRLIFAGDNRGFGVFLDKDGRELFRLRMHKNKCHHGEFNKRCDWLLATSSNDHTVKLWDVRKLHLEQDSLKASKGALHTLPHNAPVNSAFFSPSDGGRLLTTSQDSKLRVFEAPQWSTEKLCVNHPHRHFQHLTPIKATWHPFHDLIVIGRYPNPSMPTDDPIDGKKTIDIYDASDGSLRCQLLDENHNGIMVVNEFSPRAEMLASGSGQNVYIWSHGNRSYRTAEDRQGRGIDSTLLSGVAHPGKNQRSTRTDNKKRRASKDATIEDLKMSLKGDSTGKSKRNRREK